MYVRSGVVGLMKQHLGIVDADETNTPTDGADPDSTPSPAALLICQRAQASMWLLDLKASLKEEYHLSDEKCRAYERRSARQEASVQVCVRRAVLDCGRD